MNTKKETKQTPVKEIPGTIEVHEGSGNITHIIFIQHITSITNCVYPPIRCKILTTAACEETYCNETLDEVKTLILNAKK